MLFRSQLIVAGAVQSEEEGPVLEVVQISYVAQNVEHFLSEDDQISAFDQIWGVLQSTAAQTLVHFLLDHQICKI